MLVLFNLYLKKKLNILKLDEMIIIICDKRKMFIFYIYYYTFQNCLLNMTYYSYIILSTSFLDFSKRMLT